MESAITQSINHSHSFLCAAIAVVVTVAMLFDYYRHKNCTLLVSAATSLTLIHPKWTVSGISGDLGAGQSFLSMACTAIIVCLMLAMFFFGQTNENIDSSS